MNHWKPIISLGEFAYHKLAPAFSHRPKLWRQNMLMNANLGSTHFNIWGVVTSFQCQNRRGVSLRAGHVKFRNLTASSFHHFKTSLRFFLDALQRSTGWQYFYTETFANNFVVFWKPAVHPRNQLGLSILADNRLRRMYHRGGWDGWISGWGEVLSTLRGAIRVPLRCQ